jgi:hypothetical protein
MLECSNGFHPQLVSQLAVMPGWTNQTVTKQPTFKNYEQAFPLCDSGELCRSLVLVVGLAHSKTNYAANAGSDGGANNVANCSTNSDAY